MGTFSNFINLLKNEANDGKNFEKFCVWFLTNDDYWKTQVEKVWLWNEWPDRWGPDCGIDLIFKHKNGGIWAVEAKCYDESTTITKADMDSFLSESNRKKISHRLLLASTNSLSRNAIRACQGQEKPITLFLRNDFNSAHVNYPEKLTDIQKPEKRKKPVPDPHQKTAINDVIKGFQTSNRGQSVRLYAGDHCNQRNRQAQRYNWHLGCVFDAQEPAGLSQPEASIGSIPTQ